VRPLRPCLHNSPCRARVSLSHKLLQALRAVPANRERAIPPNDAQQAVQVGGRLPSIRMLREGIPGRCSTP
jgi:hypothetical protein